jgi:hypothetical protein
MGKEILFINRIPSLILGTIFVFISLAFAILIALNITTIPFLVLGAWSISNFLIGILFLSRAINVKVCGVCKTSLRIGTISLAALDGKYLENTGPSGEQEIFEKISLLNYVKEGGEFDLFYCSCCLGIAEITFKGKRRMLVTGSNAQRLCSLAEQQLSIGN